MIPTMKQAGTRRHQTRSGNATTSPRGSTMFRSSSALQNDGTVGFQTVRSTPNPTAKTFVGPISLVGGTAAIYTSLLNHPNSTMTHLSFVFMVLLALQYALQPRLSRKYIPPQVNKQSVALVEEVVKTGMAAAVFAAKPRDVLQNSLQDWTLSSSLAVAGFPAVLYAVQGVLQYISHQHLDPVTFNGLTQTKTLSAALCCWLIMGKMQSPIQVIALGILFGSALVFQGYVRMGTTKIVPDDQNSLNSKRNEDWLFRGVIPCIGAAFLSGLAGALSQKGLQLTGITGRDPFLYTVEISFFSSVTLLISMMRSNVFSKKEWEKQKAYWTWKMLIPIAVKAAGGVVTALVHKYAGSVAKGFALMFGLVLSGTIQSVLSDETLQPFQVVGTLMIMMSTWLHFTHPPI